MKTFCLLLISLAGLAAARPVAQLHDGDLPTRRDGVVSQCTKSTQGQPCSLLRASDSYVTGVCSTNPSKRWNPKGLTGSSVKALQDLEPWECLPVDDSSEAQGTAEAVGAAEAAADAATGGEVKREEPVPYCTPETEGQPCVVTGSGSTQVVGVCSRSTKRSVLDPIVKSAEGTVADDVQVVGSQCAPTYVNEYAVEQNVDDAAGTAEVAADDATGMPTP